VNNEVVILVNPATGKHKSRKQVPELYAALHRLGLRARVVVTASSAHMTACAAAAAGSRAVVIVGGDGTWHSAIQGLANTETPLALLPVGTGNDNARAMGIAGQSPMSLALRVATAEPQPITLARAQLAGGVQRWFSSVLACGFDSAVNERANTIRRPGGTLRYLAALGIELKQYAPIAYRVRVDGVEWSGDALFASVGNTAYYGGGMMVCPHANPTESTLAVTIVEYVSLPRFVSSFPSLYTGGHIKKPYVQALTGSSIHIEAIGTSVFADGEPMGHTPVQIDAHPSALRVYADLAP